MIRSLIPTGVAMDALFIKSPLALDEMFARTVYTMLAPLGKFIVSLKLVAVFDIGSHPVAPPFCDAQPQLQLAIWNGMLSAMTAPVTPLGPLFVTLTV